jgi:cysteine desulfurase/selenocysteine lyase
VQSEDFVPALIPPDRFIGLEGIAHLACGSECPMLTSHRDAIEKFLLHKGQAMAGREAMQTVVSEARSRTAALLGIDECNVAFLLNASDGLIQAAAGLDVISGGNVVVARCEYPSLPLAVLPLAKMGIEIRYAGAGMNTEIDDYAACVDEKTCAIFVSHVSYLTGDRIDLNLLRILADKVDARLIVDASHSLGAVPIDASLCDALVSSCYKWLLGVHGCGILAVNTQRWPNLLPATMGWHSVVDDGDWRAKEHYHLHSDARRFETGNPPFLAIYVLHNALQTLEEAPLEHRAAHIDSLAGQLREGLSTLGLDILTPEPSARRAGNIAFRVRDPHAIELALRERGVLVLSGLGRIRASVHLFNSSHDVERCLEALRSILGDG